MLELTKNYINLVCGGGICDCYCYSSRTSQSGAASAASGAVMESKMYTQLPHPSRCRNYCLMHDMEFDKCVYQKNLGIWSGNP